MLLVDLATKGIPVMTIAALRLASMIEIITLYVTINA